MYLILIFQILLLLIYQLFQIHQNTLNSIISYLLTLIAINHSSLSLSNSEFCILDHYSFYLYIFGILTSNFINYLLLDLIYHFSNRCFLYNALNDLICSIYLLLDIHEHILHLFLDFFSHIVLKYILFSIHLMKCII